MSVVLTNTELEPSTASATPPWQPTSMRYSKLLCTITDLAMHLHFPLRRPAPTSNQSPSIGIASASVALSFFATMILGCSNLTEWSNWSHRVEIANTPKYPNAGTFNLVHYRTPTVALRPSSHSADTTPEDSTASTAPSKPVETASAQLISAQISAQGRLQPLGGIVQLSSLPGDRIASVDVAVGQSIQAGDRLITLESEQAKKMELEGASLKLEDARAQHQAQLRDAELAVTTSQGKQIAANQQHAQAVSAADRVHEQKESIATLERQVQTLQRLRDDPLTKAAIGSLELDGKRTELRNAVQSLAQAELASKHAIEASELAIQQATELHRNAKATHEALLAANPVATVEKQIELIQLQLKQSSIHSPLNGTVIQITASAGERTATLPLIQVADLSKMACVAEIHEADIASVAPGQRVEMRSAALARPIQGKVIRIDRSIGSAQMRSPNPLSRSDFRSVPVWIEIDAADTPLASERLQLQVDTLLFSSAARTKLASPSGVR